MYAKYVDTLITKLKATCRKELCQEQNSKIFQIRLYAQFVEFQKLNFKKRKF